MHWHEVRSCLASVIRLCECAWKSIQVRRRSPQCCKEEEKVKEHQEMVVAVILLGKMEDPKQTRKLAAEVQELTSCHQRRAQAATAVLMLAGARARR